MIEQLFCELCGESYQLCLDSSLVGVCDACEQRINLLPAVQVAECLELLVSDYGQLILRYSIIFKLVRECQMYLSSAVIINPSSELKELVARCDEVLNASDKF
jgi:hypothetical protein